MRLSAWWVGTFCARGPNRRRLQERALFANCDVITTFATSHRLSSIESKAERGGERREDASSSLVKKCAMHCNLKYLRFAKYPRRRAALIDAPPCACACIVHRLIQSHPSVIRLVPVRRTDGGTDGAPFALFPNPNPYFRSSEIRSLDFWTDPRATHGRARSVGRFHVFCNAHVSDCHSWRS